MNPIGSKNISRHLAWTDTAFSEKRFRDMLDNIVGFNKIKSNTSENSIIKKIQPDGTHIWKKIRK